MKYYDCYVDGVNKLLTYSCKEIEVGSWVEVPFRGRRKVALVVEEVAKPSFTALEISSKLDIPKSDLIEIVKWMIDYYLLDSKAFSLLLPKGTVNEKKYYRIVDKSDDVSKIFKNRERLTKSTLEKKNVDIKDLMRRGVVVEESSFTVRDYLKECVSSKEKLTLTECQQSLFDEIESNKSNYFLIKAVTGSGKTAIYSELIRSALNEDRGVILLLPEIALASQIASRLSVNFDNIALIHSGLSQKQIGEEWLKVATGEKKVVIGARSAIFAPVKDLKYIVVDEEHEDVYKQETYPMYDARAVAMVRAKKHNCKLVLGSATPSVERYYHAKMKRITLLEMNKRYRGEVPKVELIDMRGTRELIHPEVRQAIEENVNRGEQTLVIINRKGYGNAVQCGSCGEVDKCDNCSVALTYFKVDNSLRCSYCDYERKFKIMCSCGSTKAPIGRGSELIEEKIKELNARVVRFDGDVNRKKGASEKIFKDFADGKYDIMVGTKLIAKGLDFSNVTLVVVIDSDSILNIPDFRASERSFQLITQASGRAGRNEKPSRVMVQTHIPDHYVMKYSGYDDFYEEEIRFREELSYPPFSRATNIIVKDKSEKRAMEISEKVYDMLNKLGVESYRPAKCLIYKINKLYRYHIFVNDSKINKKELSAIKKISKNISIDIDALNFI